MKMMSSYVLKNTYIVIMRDVARFYLLCVLLYAYVALWRLNSVANHETAGHHTSPSKRLALTYETTRTLQ